MKIFSRCPLVLCALLGLPTGRAQNEVPEPANRPAALPAIDEARVVISYAELKALLEAAGGNEAPPEPQPPVTAVVTSAIYELSLADDRPRLSARYHVRSLTAGWHLVALLGGDARLEDAGAQDGVVWRDGRYRLLTRGPGEDQFELQFALPSPEDGASEVVLCYAARLPPLDRVSGRCDLELPRTELFVHDLTWALALPDAYEPTAVEGNVSIDPRPAKEAGDSPAVLHLRRQLLGNAHPTVELYYQRRGLDD